MLTKVSPQMERNFVMIEDQGEIEVDVMGDLINIIEIGDHRSSLAMLLGEAGERERPDLAL